MIVFTDCYIGAVCGPYPGNKKYAIVLNELLDGNIWHCFAPGDVFLVDRHFRDSIAKISQNGFIAKMPEFANTPTAPLITEQANRSHLVAKNHYTVEAINGRIKQKFQYFDIVV